MKTKADIRLRVEIPEERPGRHVGGLGDVRDGDPLEPVLAEQPQGGVHQVAAGLGLLALTESGSHSRHRSALVC